MFNKSLTKAFNAKAGKVEGEVETETFGGKSLSRYFCAVAMTEKQRTREIEVEILVVKQAPAGARRLRPGMV